MWNTFNIDVGFVFFIVHLEGDFMLCSYQEKHNVNYDMLCSSVKNNKVSHAYLIDENNNKDAFNLIIDFVKKIICENGYENLSVLEKDSICKRIDDGNYSELKIIEPDGMFIKKQQIITLQQEFSREAVEGRKRVYIIRDCDKMRPETANSMLKFLEEPENDIVAILMTNNYNNILPTIISRCQTIKLHNVLEENFILGDYDKIVFDFICNLSNDGIDAILNIQELWFDKIASKDRDVYLKLFDIMIDMYYDIVKLKIGIRSIKYNEYIEPFILIADKSSLEQLLNKINFLVEVKDAIKFNINLNLLMDSVVINIGGRYESCRS